MVHDNKQVMLMTALILKQKLAKENDENLTLAVAFWDFNMATATVHHPAG